MPMSIRLHLKLHSIPMNIPLSRLADIRYVRVLQDMSYHNDVFSNYVSNWRGQGPSMYAHKLSKETSM